MIIDEDDAIKALEPWLAEATVPVDKLVSTARDEELATKVVLVVPPTSRFFLRFFPGNVADDEASIGNGDDVWCSTRDDLLSARENELDRAT